MDWRLRTEDDFPSPDYHYKCQIPWLKPRGLYLASTASFGFTNRYIMAVRKQHRAI